MPTVAPLPASGAVFPDVRGADRSLRVSWHTEVGLVVLSFWQAGTCVASARLAPADAARLVGALGAALGEALVTDGVVARTESA
ncbi:MAG TPA: hypothetical protein VNG13_04170 [Mycobacteriales bacterium]|nr:hypothetical protein [Mycobacteriales bacterium]